MLLTTLLGWLCLTPLMGLAQFECGNPVSHQGHNYATVQIGDQCWFAENCRYLPNVSPASATSNSSPLYYVYGYGGTDVEAAKATDNYANYGALYNWPAVMTDGVCPTGWYIPSNNEYTVLVNFLGGEGVAGGKMKEAGYDHWNSPNTGATNSSGWTGLGGGYCYNGSFQQNRNSGDWWTSSTNGGNSYNRTMKNNNDNVAQYSNDRRHGLTARCIWDGTTTAVVDGCMCPWACNFDDQATSEDGSCDFLSCAGCTYAWSSNYNPDVLYDDGSCIEDIVDDPCQADMNGDGIVSTADLLQFLTAFGEECD